jgi:raffinose/stachyose/melibiose transport system substrate-binding protein
MANPEMESSMTRTTKFTRSRLAIATGTAAALVVALAACAPGSGGSANPSNGGPVSTTFDTSKPVTITVDDGWGTTGSGATFATVIKNFEKKFPNVTVKRLTTDYNSYANSINLKVASNDPPDVLMLETAGYGQGFYNFVKAGDLLPLDAYAKAYNWDARFGGSSKLDVFKVDTDKNFQWGSGTLYGLPEQSSMIGVFYNKKLMDAAGVTSIPSTFAEFESSLEAAKSKGIVGIEESSTYIHTEMALWDSFSPDAPSVNNWIYGASGSFATAANLKAAQTIQDWQAAGYFEPGAQGQSDSDAAAAFFAGKAMYYIEGSWNAGNADTTFGQDGGVFQLPSISEQSPVGGGPSTPLVISAKSKNQAVAAAFLNYFVSAKNTDYLFQNGWGAPGALVSTGTKATGPTSQAVLDAITKINSTTGPGTTPFLDWASPTFGTELPSALQSMASGNTTPESFTSSIQSGWTTFHQQRKSS